MEGKVLNGSVETCSFVHTTFGFRIKIWNVASAITSLLKGVFRRLSPTTGA